MTKSIKILLLLIGLAVAAFGNPGAPFELSIIPKPLHEEIHKGMFTLNGETRIVYFAKNAEVRSTVEQFAARVRTATGYKLPIKDGYEMPSANFIFFDYVRDKSLGEEGYRLNIDRNRVVIDANADGGLYYGMQTLLQLFPPEIYSPKAMRDMKWKLPCVSIADAPRFLWRGMHLDVSRHFFPKDFVETYIDMIAMHKMNVFHWHLTDDQGWRIEIKKYPRLTEVGAWRVNREDQPWNSRDQQKPGEAANYGGFYTQADIKEVVKYAADRHVTIVPEIEMPAHCVAALAAYPQFSCS